MRWIAGRLLIGLLLPLTTFAEESYKIEVGVTDKGIIRLIGDLPPTCASTTTSLCVNYLEPNMLQIKNPGDSQVVLDLQFVLPGSDGSVLTLADYFFPYLQIGFSDTSSTAVGESVGIINGPRLFAIHAEGVGSGSAFETDHGFSWQGSLAATTPSTIWIYAGNKTIATVRQTPFEEFHFYSSWAPIAWLGALLETITLTMAKELGSTGLAVVLLAFLVRCVSYPLSRWCNARNTEFSAAQASMQSELKNIKANLKGAKQSEAILQLYKKHNITPLSGLKGQAALLIQIPVLVGFFAVVYESAVFENSFLWMNALNGPDALLELSFSIRFMGDEVNVLPFLLFVALLLPGFAAGSYPNTSQITFSLVICLLLYSFPAALLMFWMTSNVVLALEKWIQGPQDTSHAVSL